MRSEGVLSDSSFVATGNARLAWAVTTGCELARLNGSLRRLWLLSMLGEGLCMTPEKTGGDEGTMLGAALPGTSSTLVDDSFTSQDGIWLTAIGVRIRGTVAEHILGLGVEDDSDDA